MKFNHLILLVISLLFSYQTKSQSELPKYTVTGKITNLKNQKLYLAYYFGSNQQVITDSTNSNDKGEFKFSGNSILPEGLYMLNYAPSKYIDLLMVDQNFEVNFDSSRILETIEFKNSNLNQDFYDYQRKMKDFSTEFRNLQIKNDKNEMMMVRSKVLGFQESFLERNKNNFLGKIISASIDPIIPEYTGNLISSADSLAKRNFEYQYFKSHFFDKIDLNDARLMRTPIIEPKIDFYFNRLVPQVPDSIITHADRILKDLKNTELKRFIVYKITNTAENSNILGMDKVFVHMGEDYYLKNPQDYDSTLIANFKSRIKTMKPLLNGSPMPTLYLTDTLGKEFIPETINSKYLLVFFYDPDCSHCKSAAPELIKLIPFFKEHDIKLLAVSIERNKTKWLNFIHEQNFNQFYNGIDIHINPQTKNEEYFVDFYSVFDVVSTPTIYILDAEKKILIKKMGVEEIKTFINYHERN
ncbi:MAG: hypothetical protein RIR51_1929 [Bacteroidota bacterium]